MTSYEPMMYAAPLYAVMAGWVNVGDASVTAVASASHCAVTPPLTSPCHLFDIPDSTRLMARNGFCVPVIVLITVGSRRKGIA